MVSKMDTIIIGIIGIVTIIAVHIAAKFCFKNEQVENESVG